MIRSEKLNTTDVRYGAFEGNPVRYTDIESWIFDYNGKWREWLDHTFFGPRPHHERHITIENGRTHGIARSRDVDMCRPGANANGDGPVVDFSACADKADTRVDPLCHPLTRTSRQSAQTTTASQRN